MSAASFGRAYARHVGLERPDIEEEVRRRLARLPWWARLAATGGALYVCRLAPTLLLGRPAVFETLDDDAKEDLLARLQGGGSPPVRALFLCLKTVVLGAVYGPPGLAR